MKNDAEEARRAALEAIAADPTLSAVLEIWETKRRDRFAPHPSDLDAFTLPAAALSRIMLVDVEQPGPRFRYRLVGTTIAAAAGKDLTGQYVDEVFPGRSRGSVLERYRTVVERKRPAYAVAEYRLPGGQSVKNAGLVVPLTTEGTEVDRLLLVLSVVSDWLLQGKLQDVGRQHEHQAVRSYTVL